MKKNLLSLRSLLVAAGLCAGVNAWADVEITETYDFYSWTSADAVITKATDDDFNVTGVDSDGTRTMAYASTVTIGGTAHTFGNRLALDNYSNGSSFGWRFRNTGTTYQKGLVTQGKDPNWRPFYFSICNLKEGDKVKVTYSFQSGKDAQPYFVSANATYDNAGTPTIVTVNSTKMTSGTEYTMTADGHLDLVVKNNNFAMHSVVITTTGTESVSTPTFSITGASGKGRKVTITGGTSDAGNSVTTYYTTDGSEPTTSSSSFTTATKEITVGESAESESTIIVKAYTVSNTGAESSIGSENVTVGTNVVLAAPSISLSTFTQDGTVYHPTYTFSSDQSGIVGGTPASITYSYKFESGTDTEASSYSATASGSLTVTISADGYTSNSTTQSIVGGDYSRSYSFDATSVTLKDGATAGSGGTNQSADGTSSSMYALSECEYSLRDDITLSGGFVFAWKITLNQPNCFYTRGSAGAINYSLNSGEYIEFKNSTTSVIATSEGTSTAFAIYNAVKYIYVYTPAVVTATIGTTGYTTFASPYALDLSAIDASTGEGAAYYASAVDGSNATFSLTTATVGAGEGLLLKGDAGATLTIPVVASGAPISGNLLVGCTTAQNGVTGANKYVLVKNGATAEFQNLGTNSADIPAGKAYLDASTLGGAPSLRIVFGDEPSNVSGISQVVEKVAESGKYYDLTGRAVSTPATKGLYILDGRKVIVR